MEIVDFKSLDTASALMLARELALREYNDPHIAWPPRQEKPEDVFFRICDEMVQQPLKLDKTLYGLIEKLDAQLFGAPEYLNTATFILRGDPVKISKAIAQAGVPKSCQHAWVNWFVRALQENKKVIKRGSDLYGMLGDLESAINPLMTTLAPDMKKLPVLWKNTFTPSCMAYWDAYHDARCLDASTPRVSAIKPPRRM